MITPHSIIRSNRKTLSVSVDRFGRVTVRAPKNCDEKRIFAFLRDKEEWIRSQVQQMRRTGMRLPPTNLDGYEFLLLGKTCRIRLYDGEKICHNAVESELYLPRANARERLVRWLKDNAKRIFTEVTERKARQMCVGFQKVRVSSAKTRWGSCSGRNVISYTFRLLYVPKEVVEYVVVHELAHVRHKNHAKAFWAEVERYMPDYKQCKQWLKTHGYLVQIF